MNLLKSDKRHGITDWRTEDGKFSGVLIDAVVIRERGSEDRIELPAAALLAVPKYKGGDRPSINKYSPVIAQADTEEELAHIISAWADKNADMNIFDLRIKT